MAKAKYTRCKDGYFKTNVWDGTYKDGKKHYITLRSRKSSRDLENMVNDHNQKIKERDFVRPSNVTFQEYAIRWQKAYKSHLEANTINMYTNIIKTHFEPLQCVVGDINKSDYIIALGKVKGSRTKQQFQMVFKQVLRSAISDKLLPASVYDEILKDDIKIKYKPKEKRPLTEEEKKAINLCQFKHKRDEIFLQLLYHTGMRGEEIRALTIFDVNLKKNEITVNKAVAFSKEKPILKGTKNGKERTIPIDSIAPLLAEYIKDLDNTKLFSMPNGEYITKITYRRMWERVLAEMQKHCSEPIKDLTPHIFRHNFCTSLCYQIPNISIPKIAELLGDSEKMVIEVYNHAMQEREKPHDIVAKALAT